MRGESSGHLQAAAAVTAKQKEVRSHSSARAAAHTRNRELSVRKQASSQAEHMRGESSGHLHPAAAVTAKQKKVRSHSSAQTAAHPRNRDSCQSQHEWNDTKKLKHEEKNYYSYFKTGIWNIKYVFQLIFFFNCKVIGRPIQFLASKKEKGYVFIMGICIIFSTKEICNPMSFPYRYFQTDLLFCFDFWK